jgi:hypothetical protein
VTPGAASRPTFGLPEPTTFGLPGSPGNQAATFGLPSMGLAPKLGPLPTTAVEEKKPTAPPAEEVAAQCQHCPVRKLHATAPSWGRGALPRRSI